MTHLERLVDHVKHRGSLSREGHYFLLLTKKVLVFTNDSRLLEADTRNPDVPTSEDRALEILTELGVTA